MRGRYGKERNLPAPSPIRVGGPPKRGNFKVRPHSALGYPAPAQFVRSLSGHNHEARLLKSFVAQRNRADHHVHVRVSDQSVTQVTFAAYGLERP